VVRRGEHCAGALADGGLHVALIERELVGGECSYCASKTLLRPGEAVHAARVARAITTGRLGTVLAWREDRGCASVIQPRRPLRIAMPHWFGPLPMPRSSALTLSA
jgi:hypothetical protein